MCLAIPMKVKSISGSYGVVEINGVTYNAGLQLLKDVRVGDYVIIHAGFAIQKLSRKDALEIQGLFREAGQLPSRKPRPKRKR